LKKEKGPIFLQKESNLTKTFKKEWEKKKEKKRPSDGVPKRGGMG